MNKQINGVIPVNKPAGITSHRVVSVMRARLGTRKVGHSGTLDPMATGVLPIVVGSASKLSDYLMRMPKSYLCTLRLGAETTTQDSEGSTLRTGNYEDISEEKLIEYLKSQVGEIIQIPPDYSAVKTGGEKYLDIARRGEKVKNKKSRKVTIHSLDIIKICKPELTFTVNCSKGTYIRTICHDLGIHFGCYAHMTSLTRLSSGGFNLDESVDMEETGAEHLLSLGDVASRINYMGRIDLNNLNSKSKKMFLDGVKMNILDSKNAVIEDGYSEYFVYFDGEIRSIAGYENDRLVIVRGLI